jgi:anti-sigma B factor antagonist
MALRLSTRSEQGVTIMDCAGRITFGEEASQVRELVRKLLPETRHIVLNLAQVDYIDSGGLGMLVGLYTSAKNAGGDIKLANLTQRVGDVLQITKLVTVFEVYDDEQKAIASCHRPMAPTGD